jgi:hypothetical protein
MKLPHLTLRDLFWLVLAIPAGVIAAFALFFGCVWLLFWFQSLGTEFH